MSHKANIMSILIYGQLHASHQPQSCHQALQRIDFLANNDNFGWENPICRRAKLSKPTNGSVLTRMALNNCKLESNKRSIIQSDSL